MASRPRRDISVVRALLIDLDGVVYRGASALPGSKELFHFLRSRSMPFCLITNNSTRRSSEVARQLEASGIDVRTDEVLTSAEAAADYLSRVAAAGTRVMVIGEDGLRSAVRRSSFTISATDPSFVVVGLDRRLTYAKLAQAAGAIRKGATFIATNLDATVPTEAGEVPGAGAIVAALAVSTGQSPKMIGKPEPLMVEIAIRRVHAAPQNIAIVGDRLGTDILAGKRMGLVTCLMLTGVTDRSELRDSKLAPDFVFANLDELREALDQRHDR